MVAEGAGPGPAARSEPSVELPLITASREELLATAVKELKKVRTKPPLEAPWSDARLHLSGSSTPTLCNPLSRLISDFPQRLEILRGKLLRSMHVCGWRR